MTEKNITRRKFIFQTGKAALAASLFGAGYLVLDTRADFPVEEAAKTISADYSINDISLLKKLAVAAGENPAELVRKALGSLGGMEKFVSRGDYVVIKPNVAWDRTPQQAANTNPEVVAETVRLALGAGASKVVVTDVTCHEARRTFARSGIMEACQNAGAEVIIPKEEDFVEVDMEGKLLTSWPVLKYFIEADKVINIPIVKNHTLSRATLGMKNLYGIIGGRRNQLHQSIDQSIVDLANFLKPTLVIVDAYRVLMRHGPTGGSLGDVKQANTLFATVDQVAADAFACQFLDLDPARVAYIPMAEKTGLGSMNINEFEIVQS